MRKIGIITFHNAVNYGAVLQAYALKYVIKTLFPKDDVNVINYKNYFIEKTYKVIQKKKSLISFLFQFIYVIDKLIVNQKFKNFSNEYLVDSEEKKIKDFDIIIYGSDQIWNPLLTDNDLIFLGEGFSGIKIAYAASDDGKLNLFGDSVELIKKFSSLSCREEYLSKNLREILDFKTIQTVCDPVFLLKNEEWQNFLVEPKLKSEYVLLYQVVRNEEFEKKAIDFAKETKRELINIVYCRSIKSFMKRGIRTISRVSPKEFVGYFYGAAFVFTSSFHGTAFSIIFRKPFITTKTNERINNLCSILDLANRNEFYSSDFENSLSAYREKSLDYIKSAIGDVL